MKAKEFDKKFDDNNEDIIDDLDKVADARGCDRSHVLNQAIETYLGTDGWQIQHIREGQKQARNGEFVPEKTWRSGFNRNR